MPAYANGQFLINVNVVENKSVYSTVRPANITLKKSKQNIILCTVRSAIGKPKNS